MKAIRALPAAGLAALLGLVPMMEPATAAPSAPGQVQQVRLQRRVRGLDTSWAKIAGKDVRYVVQKSVNGKAWTRVESTRQTTSRVKGLPPVEVQIRVRAVRNGIRGAWSEPVAMTPSDPDWVNRRFRTRPVGAALPTGERCASRVRPAPETVRANNRRNRNTGSSPHDLFPLVTGDFTGTTDEILQWVACKWGLDEDLVRAQAMVESSWRQGARGDYVTTRKWCHPALREERPCPMSVGLFQIAYRWHHAAYEGRNVMRSTAYNADYTYERWRRCFEGDFGWLNDYPRGRRYRAGNALGCIGVWNAGRWYTDTAKAYIERVRTAYDDETWKHLQYTSGERTVEAMTADAVLNERPHW